VLAVLLGSLNLAWLTAEERVRWLGILRCLGFERAEVSRYLLLRAGMISTLAYLAALGAALAFIAYAADADRFTVGGAQASLRLGPGTALAGLALASLASVAGTWLLVRRVLRAAPATLLGRQAGGS
jgi:ABC-type antimicrobial peptide transport system permease subunit